MRVLWDETKRLRNIRSHAGLDFADLTPDFFQQAKILPAKGGRWMAIGSFRGFVIAVVFARLGTEALSVVSMRRASRKERTIL